MSDAPEDAVIAHLFGLSWTVNPVVKDTLGWLGVVCVLFLFVSPLKDIWGENGVYQLKSTHRLATGLPYFATFANCLTWAVYAYFHEPNMMLQPFVINVFGAILTSTYCVCFAYYCSNRQHVKVIVVGTVCLIGFAFAAWGIAKSVEAVGTTAAGVNIVMYYSPLDALSDVWHTKSVARMPFLPTILTLCSSVFWLSYGVYIVNWPVMLPNACGVILGSIQVSVYTYFARYDTNAGYVPLAADEENEERASTSSTDVSQA